MSVTNEQLAEWRAKTDAATEGPWAEREEAFYCHKVISEAVPYMAGNLSLPDAEFIASAREAMPALLDEVERLRDVVNEARGIIALAGDVETPRWYRWFKEASA